ncbi:MAG: methionyl-tRNA formyltransferase [Pseudomonadota bacterium]
MSKSLNIVFMGTPDFAATALQALIDSPHNIIAVYSQPPRPKGRGQSVQKSAVHELADAHDIPIFTPKNFKSEEAVQQFENLKADVGVVAAYGLILPQVILDAPTHGCLNIHGSLLPRWRGAAPIQRAIEAGDTQSGITIMQMNAGLDTGPMIMEESVAITDQTTAQTLHDDLAEVGGRLIVKTLNILADKNALCHTPQDDSKATYAHMLKKEEGQIDWSKTAEDVNRKIRALTPWPGTYCFTADGKRLKIHQAAVSDQTSDKSLGTILDDGQIVCGAQTVLQLHTVQPENKKPMDVQAAINGGYLKAGEVLK